MKFHNFGAQHPSQINVGLKMQGTNRKFYILLLNHVVFRVADSKTSVAFHFQDHSNIRSIYKKDRDEHGIELATLVLDEEEVYHD